MHAVIVSDSSPLNYLVLIGAETVRPKITDKILIPPEVRRELLHPNTSARVRSWMEAPPTWLEVIAPSRVKPGLNQDAGESEAISLALECDSQVLLIDERKGTYVARELGLNVIGTLSVLKLGTRLNLIDFEAYLLRLRATTFRISEKAIQEVRASLQS